MFRLVALLLVAVVLMPADAAPPPEQDIPPLPTFDETPTKGFPELPKFDPENPPEMKGTTSFPNRSGATKAKLIKEGGGNEQSETAVALGLAWLAKQQKADGSWVYDQGDKSEITAATGMALLAFLGAGETHLGKGKYQKTVEAGLNWLLRNLQSEKGPKYGKFALSGTMYAQAIGTIPLCEAYGMTKDKNLFGPAQSAIEYIQKSQAANGSWGYAAGMFGDTSIVGWQIQALQAGILTKDIVVDPKVIKKAVDFLNVAGRGARKAMYGYIDNTEAAPGTALTAVGLLCRYYIDKWSPENAGMAEGVLGLMKRAPLPSEKMPDMYFYYYATQVVHLFGGDEWKQWNDGKKKPDGTREGGMRDWLISLQIKKEGTNLGSWDPELAFIGRSCGRVGTTALCLLTLEVYYRYLPLYKSGLNGDASKILGKDK